MKKFLLFIFIIGIHSFIFSQTKNLDSLWKIFNNKTQADSHRLKIIHEIAWGYTSNRPDTAILLGEKELHLAQNKKFKKYEAKAYNVLGAAYTNKGMYPKALEYYFNALQIFEEIGNKRGISNSYTNIGNIYNYGSNYQKALEYYLKALKICEETRLPDGQLANKSGTAACYTNIGNVYFYILDYRRALKYYIAALKINEQIEDKPGLAACYGNMGSVYQNMSNYSLSLKYYFKDLSISKEIIDKQQTALCYNNIAGSFIKMSNFEIAIQYCDSSLQICIEISDLDDMRLCYQNLAIAYSKIEQYKKAYENHVQFKQLTDSIFNAENRKQLGDIKTKFEVEKKEAELTIKAVAQQAISAEEKKRQQLVIYSVAGVLLIVIISSLFLYKRFLITNRQKNIIEKQKVMVDKTYAELHEKNKEVIDSINYAKRIQTALLTSEKYIQRSLSKLQKD